MNKSLSGLREALDLPALSSDTSDEDRPPPPFLKSMRQDGEGVMSAMRRFDNEVLQLCQALGSEGPRRKPRSGSGRGATGESRGPGTPRDRGKRSGRSRGDERRGGGRRGNGAGRRQNSDSASRSGRSARSSYSSGSDGEEFRPFRRAFDRSDSSAGSRRYDRRGDGRDESRIDRRSSYSRDSRDDSLEGRGENRQSRRSYVPPPPDAWSGSGRPRDGALMPPDDSDSDFSDR